MWEETAAKHVSLALQLAPVAGLATRWRRLELDSWKLLLQQTIARFALGANQAWFHLYRILVDGETPVTDVSAVLAEFIQNSPLGEYATRLQMLLTFKWQLEALRSAEPAVGHPGQVERWDQLAAVLHNTHRYYAQFQPHVDSKLSAGFKDLEKHLKVKNCAS